MKWTSLDLQKYDQAKEYIDTVIIPLAPFQIGSIESSIKHADQFDVLTILGRELEKELMGRVMLAPVYTYLAASDKEGEVNRLNTWSRHLEEQPFKNVLFISFDPSWRKIAKELEGEFIWLPSATLKDANPDTFKEIIRDQTSQTVELIKSFW